MRTPELHDPVAEIPTDEGAGAGKFVNAVLAGIVALIVLMLVAAAH